MNLVTLAVGNLRRRMMRTSVVSLSVGLAVASALSLVSLADSIENGVREGIDERNADLTVLKRNASDIFSGFITDDLVSQIAGMPGVAAVAGDLIMFAPVGQEQQKLVVGGPPDGFIWKSMPLLAGTMPSASASRYAILGSGAAEVLHKSVGDELTILDEPFHVAAIANYQSALNRSMVFVPLQDLQDVAFRQKQITILNIRLSPGIRPEQVESLKGSIAAIGPLLVTPTDQFLRNDRYVGVMRSIARTVSLIALIMGALSVLSTLLMAIQERTSEIGIMTAIGWGYAQTMTSIVIEGSVIGVLGSILGIAMSYVVSYSFADLPIIGEMMSFHPIPEMFLPSLLISVLLCAIGSLYPAWRAAAMSPADALRRF
jgi:putative ABC transport system permease protein